MAKEAAVYVDLSRSKHAVLSKKGATIIEGRAAIFLGAAEVRNLVRAWPDVDPVEQKETDPE
jgi:hypothetical protein